MRAVAAATSSDDRDGVAAVDGSPTEVNLSPADRSAGRTRGARRRPATPVDPLAARRLLTRAAGGSGIACLFAGSAFAASYVLLTFPHRVQLAASALVLGLIVAGLFVAGAAARELLYWRGSLRRLARLSNELRAGEAALSELDAIGGGAEVLVEPVRSILLDLREQKRVNAELREEMRQRIFNRTDALERQLGVMKTQASRDALTGLGNRRGLDAVASQMFSACRGSREDLCVLMIDVDNFKPLNDTLGHAAGDEMLKGIADVLRSSIRENDGAYRIGGDEFVVLLPRASRLIGERLAGRLTKLVELLAQPLNLPHPPALSIGIAALSDDESGEAKDLLARADRHLYELKQGKTGRLQRPAA